MKRLMVRYKVKPEHVAENEELVRGVYDELHRTDPTGFGYATFALDDGVSFVHLVNEGAEGSISLTDLPAFKRFVEHIGDRCDEPPVTTILREIGSFHLFD